MICCIPGTRGSSCTVNIIVAKSSLPVLYFSTARSPILASHTVVLEYGII